jgi:cyclopropane fatty-acyl-phospholipid synthase-like methyltransferase
MKGDRNKGGFSNPAETWDRRFSTDDFLFGVEPNQWLHDNASWQAGEKVLSVADGEGRNSVWLASQGIAVDAFDISEVGVAKARKFAQQRGVQARFEVADCDSFNWPINHFDGVALIFVQFATPDVRQRLFSNAQASLKPGGTMILQGYTPKQLDYKTGGPPLLSHLYTESMLREAFRDMEILKLQAYEAELKEGEGHHGQSALIGMVARKK